MKKLLLYVFLAAFISCEFPLDQKNFVELSQTPTSNVKIKLINLPDTVMVINDLTIEYELDVTSTPAGGIFARIGNEVGYVGQAFKGSFVISNLNDQVHDKGYLPFEFFVIATTGTGSLADRSYRETKVYSVKKTLYFDNSPAYSLPIKTIEVTNGSLILSWDKYPFGNLKSLKLRKTFNGTEVTEIIDPKAISYEDKAVLGLDIDYEFISTNNIGISATGPKAKYTNTAKYTGTISEFTTNANGKLVVKWNKPPFLTSCNGYSLWVNGDWAFQTSNPLDTVATIDLPFGIDKELALTTYSKNSNNTISNKRKAWLGKKIPTFQSVLFDSSHNRFFYMKSPYLVKEELGGRDSTTIDFNSIQPTFISQDGNSIYLSKENQVREINANSLSLINSYTLPITNFSSFVVSGNNFICSVDQNVVVIDKGSNSIIQTYLHEPSRLSLTPNSEYLLTDGIDKVCLLQLDPSGSIVDKKCEYAWVGAISKDENFIYLISSALSQMRYTFPDLTYSQYYSAYNVQLKNYNNVDKFKFLAGSFDYGNYVLYDLATPAFIKTIKAPNQPDYLMGGTLFKVGPDLAYALKIK